VNWAFQSINEGSLLKLRHSLCNSSKKNIDEIGKNFVKYLSHLFVFFFYCKNNFEPKKRTKKSFNQTKRFLNSRKTLKYKNFPFLGSYSDCISGGFWGHIPIVFQEVLEGVLMILTSKEKN